jgi:CRISPR/Cas system endoribonuclease Cas6 (RAMP superfamily)
MNAFEIGKIIGNTYNDIRKLFSLELAESCNKNKYFVTKVSAIHGVKNIEGKFEYGSCIIVDTLNQQGDYRDFENHSFNLFNYLSEVSHWGEFLN